MNPIFQIHSDDNVAVALQSIAAGTVCATSQGTVCAQQDIPAGHKIALHTIDTNQSVIKYGYPIGHATQPIRPGDWVHTHNLSTSLQEQGEYQYHPSLLSFQPMEPDHFLGYRREDGKVGIRNEIWILPTVGCVASIAQNIASAAQQRNFPGIDGVYAFSHPYGCSQLGEDHKNTQKLLAGLARHPNAGAVLVLGLGCENNNIPEFQKVLGSWNPQRVKFLNCQDFSDELTEAMKLIEELAVFAGTQTREPIPASELIIGLKCGGSDGFSGITANPLAGALSDRLIRQGGSAILTEVPEMFGAETILMDRCKDRETFEKTVHLINGFKEYFTASGQPVYENPSPGNKAGGISTLEDKSLGCIQKGGQSIITDVLSYAQPVSQKGLSLLEGPGNDLVASTALAASGAHLVIFTTGRGTPFGCPVPTIKVSSNSTLAANKSGWIDFNAGQLLDGISMDALCDQFWKLILNTASGTFQTSSERHNCRDLAIFKTGVTL